MASDLPVCTVTYLREYMRAGRLVVSSAIYADSLGIAQQYSLPLPKEAYVFFT